MRAIWTTCAALALFGTPAMAAPNRQALDTALEAIRLDFALDGVVGSDDEVLGKYREACELGYGLACKPKVWRDGGVPDLALAAKAFDQRCARADPVACLVDGWSIEAAALPDDTNEGNRQARELERLEGAQQKYRVGCRALYWPACAELAAYSLRRASYESADSKLRNEYERGGDVLQKQACADRNIFSSCVLLGRRGPQLAEEIDVRYSAAWLYNKACEGGYIEGCYRQGVIQSQLRSSEENRHWFDDLCQRGHTASCETVAKSWGAEEGGESNALDAWTRACTLRSVEGCDIAGPALAESNPEQAMDIYMRGCDLKHGESCGRLGAALIERGDAAAAVPYLDTGCEAGVVEACVQVGGVRLSDPDIEGGANRALSDLRWGCPEDGARIAQACAGVAAIYEEGKGPERDRATAARYYRYACDDDDLNSCFALGNVVMALNRVARTDQRLSWALDGFTKACDGGNQAACLPAAKLLGSGPESLRDPAKAGELFTSLCDNSDPVACMEWGLWSLGETGSKDNLKHARSAFQKGADLEDTESMRQLGKMYFFGQGGKRSKGKAKKLFRRSCKAGNVRACGGVSTPDRGT